MLSNLSIERLRQVHPELARRINNLVDALESEGIIIEIDTALRTPAEQDNLYAIGRTVPGTKVTHAKGFQSNHVIGCAVDVSPVDPILNRADWNATHPSWQRIVALAPAHGLRDGKSWHDLPHLELAEIPTEPTPEIQELCRVGGVQAVWDQLAIDEFSS